MLSAIAQIFDPLGLIGPVVLAAKLFLRQLWQLKSSWDAPIDENLDTFWSNFYNQLNKLNDIRISRHVILPKSIFVVMHIFSDASQRAYGACVYIKSQDEHGNVIVRLLTSKSRVAPLKP